jgi:hypothetical protein
VVTKAIEDVLAEPFLLIQIGDYGHGYDCIPLPVGLHTLALERSARGEHTYPQNDALPAPHFHVPSDVRGIIMNKADEISLLGFAYWAQTLATRVHKRGCMNSRPKELCKIAREISNLRALLVTNTTTAAPKGNAPGRIFERWTEQGYFREAPTDRINTDIVYTETGRSTLIFRDLEIIPSKNRIDLNQYHVFFTSPNSVPEEKYRGTRLPYRASMYGSCSLLEKGKPDIGTEIPALKPENASRQIVALATIHPHVCGRVR